MAKFYQLGLIVLFPFTVWSQAVVLTGHVEDAEGKNLAYAHILFHQDSTLRASDADGNFKHALVRGDVSLSISFTGYETLSATLLINRDTSVTFILSEKIDQLKEVVVTSQKYSQADIFESTRSSTAIVTQDDINAIPVLGGEADVLKTIQLLPGTIRGVEGSSDLFVRGGAADQNLVLLDQAPIYNTSHLFGFLSVFNPDILEKVEVTNGGFPANYGGRLSSVLDIQSKPDMAVTTHVSGDIGLIASRVFIEQPLVKNKIGIWVGGRRTYVDQVMKALDENVPYFFYDLNGKLIANISRRDKIQVAYYGGEDNLDYFRDRNGDGDGVTTSFKSGNNSQTIQWNRDWLNNWSTNVSLIRTAYRYNIRNAFEENELLAVSDIEDLGAKVLFENDSVSRGAIIKAGLDWTQHRVSPNVINTAGLVAEFLESSYAGGRQADEMAAHFQYEWSPLRNWRINAGLRTSLTVVENRSYFYPEPRLSLRYSLDTKNSIKLSYSRMVQSMHRVSSSAVSSPTDIWYPVTDKISPQTSHQVSAAWQRMLPAAKMFLSIESYYKKMDNLIGYEEGTNLFFNTDFESSLLQGEGKAYGFEFLMRKEAGKFTGWISYTLSWSWRRFDEINHGNWFYSRYDRRHNGAVVVQYAFKKRWAFSMVWEFISGSRFTPVIGKYLVLSPGLNGVDIVPVYSKVNGVKLADTHRLDLGIKFRSQPEKKFQWQWFAGVYNVYNRASPVSINIRQDQTDQSLSYEQPGLFGLLPFISYGFKF